MTNKLYTREWIGIAFVLGAILTILVVSKISERRIYKILQDALDEVNLPLETGK